MPETEAYDELALTRRLLADVPLSPDAQQVHHYLNLLLRWNRRFNLTAASHYHELLERHFLDSLNIAPWLCGENILDVGTGAGLPGIPMALAFPDRRFELLDSNGKKCRFLQQVRTELGLDNVMIRHDRIERFQPAVAPDCILSRAFAPLGRICELCRPVCHENTRLLCMKGRSLEAELPQIPADFHLDTIESLPGAINNGARLAILRWQPTSLEAS